MIIELITASATALTGTFLLILANYGWEESKAFIEQKEILPTKYILGTVGFIGTVFIAVGLYTFITTIG